MIYTYEKGKPDKVKCEATEWYHLIDDGWVFVGMKGLTNHVYMTRKGYINEFWMEE
jgi:hypothetical protein